MARRGVTSNGRTYEEFHDDGGFLCVLCGQTLCIRGATRYAFIAEPCPSLGPLQGIRRGHGVTRHTDPFHQPHDRHPFEPPFIHCPPKCNVTPCHASDNFDTTPSKMLKIAASGPQRTCGPPADQR